MDMFKMIKMMDTDGELASLPKAAEFFNMSYHLAFEKADNEDDHKVFIGLLDDGFEGCINYHIKKTTGIFEYSNYAKFMKSREEVAALEEDRDLYKKFYEDDMRKNKELKEELKEKDKMIKDFDVLCEKKDAKLKLQSEKIDLAYQTLRDMKHLSKIGDLVSLSEVALGYSAKDIKHKYITQWGLIVSCYNEYRVEEEVNGSGLSALKFVELIGSILDTEPPKKIKKVVVKKDPEGAKHYEIVPEGEGAKLLADAKEKEQKDLDVFEDNDAEEKYPPH
tara:strand:- start:20 stop:853 length:834 start_codon:yes stop_codon:yes gene_type:complete